MLTAWYLSYYSTQIEITCLLGHTSLEALHKLDEVRQNFTKAQLVIYKTVLKFKEEVVVCRETFYYPLLCYWLGAH